VPSYGQVSSSSKVNLREDYLATIQMKLLMFALLFSSSAEYSPPVAAASRRRRQRSGRRPGHHDQERPGMFITGRWRPRQGLMPRALSAQQRLTRESAPPNNGQVPSSSNVHRPRGHIASVQMKLVTFTLFFRSSAEYQVTASHNERLRGQRPGHHDLVTNNYRGQPEYVIFFYGGSKQLAPHTNGPRDESRCGALSLLQKLLHYMGIRQNFLPG
jgi:hypothetical protein